ncbi:hypothetical protein ACHAWF_018715 [Thalassiosira exigua]
MMIDLAKPAVLCALLAAAQRAAVADTAEAAAPRIADDEDYLPSDLPKPPLPARGEEMDLTNGTNSRPSRPLPDALPQEDGGTGDADSGGESSEAEALDGSVAHNAAEEMQFQTMTAEQLVAALIMNDELIEIRVGDQSSSHIDRCAAYFSNGHALGNLWEKSETTGGPVRDANGNLIDTGVPVLPDTGVILSSGNPRDFNHNDRDDQTTDHDEDGDGDLKKSVDLSNGWDNAVYDACVLEFEFRCPQQTVAYIPEVQFKYVWGSEEYYEYVHSQFNDVFGFYLNDKNIARLPTTDTNSDIVSINNVNYKNNFKYFHGNDPGTGWEEDPGDVPYDLAVIYPQIEADGFTDTLTAWGEPESDPLTWNRIKLAVGDVGDGILDSWVLLEGASFACHDVTEAPSQSQAPSGVFWSFVARDSINHAQATQSTTLSRLTTSVSSILVSFPTPAPSEAPTVSQAPTPNPTLSPTLSTAPTEAPSLRPTTSTAPTGSPSASPTVSAEPTGSPSASPTVSSRPTGSPSESPTVSSKPTASPSDAPTVSTKPSASPSASPTISSRPTGSPSASPTLSSEPTASPSDTPTVSTEPTSSPSTSPTASSRPTGSPSDSPTVSSKPTGSPSASPTVSSEPTALPSASPTISSRPTGSPSASPTLSSEPTASPSDTPTVSTEPTTSPSTSPTVSSKPSGSPSDSPTASSKPTGSPSASPTVSSAPTALPSASPTISSRPTGSPSALPTVSSKPTAIPSDAPSVSTEPTTLPSAFPSTSSRPTVTGSMYPSSSKSPSAEPTETHSQAPSNSPSASPTKSVSPTTGPSDTPTLSTAPSDSPSASPTVSTAPTDKPSENPTFSSMPSDRPSVSPTVSSEPTASPSDAPTVSTEPSALPSASPTISSRPTESPSASPTLSSEPTASPSDSPTVSTAPTTSPSMSPTASSKPSGSPSDSPTVSSRPTGSPSASPTVSSEPTALPSASPTVSSRPTGSPSVSPTVSSKPTAIPSDAPSVSTEPTTLPSAFPSTSSRPTVTGSMYPSSSKSPSAEPTETHSQAPSNCNASPTKSVSPTAGPSDTPTLSTAPSDSPSASPTVSTAPTDKPSESPTASSSPTASPSMSPTESSAPSLRASDAPSTSSMPSDSPSASPSVSSKPTDAPSLEPTLSTAPSSVPTSRGSIGPNTVFNDTDADGVQDEGEGPLDGVTIHLNCIDENGDAYHVDTVVTDAEGQYEFDEIAPSTCYVEVEVEPQDYIFSPVDPNGNQIYPNGTSPVAEVNYNENVEGWDTVDTWSVGMYLPLSQVGPNVVFNDLDEDGVQDEGEGPLEGVAVSLVCDGTEVDNTATNSEGVYEFSDVQPGECYVSVTPELDGNDEYVFSPVVEGGDSQIYPNGTSPTVAIGYNQTVDTWDVGMYLPLSSVGPNVVFNDLDQDGVQDEGEGPLEGVEVALVCDGTEVDSTATDAEGVYEFSDVQPGECYVSVTPELDGNNYVFSPVENGGNQIHPNGTSPTVSVGYNDTLDTWNVGMYLPLSQIGPSAVFNDVNQDGILDEGEEPLVGVPISLVCDGQTVNVTTSNSDGVYEFTGVQPGECHVEVTPQPDYNFSPIVDAGNQINATGISPTVWEDRNANGIQEDDEPGLPGITVTLVNGTGDDYSVRFELPVDYEFAPPPPPLMMDPDLFGGTLPDMASDVTPSLTSGEENNSFDAGMFLPVTINGTAWHDLNADGVEEDGEPPLSGVTVTLFNAEGETVGSQVTGADGVWEFDELPPGTYEALITPPDHDPEYMLSPSPADESETSRTADFDYETWRTAPVTLLGGENGDGSFDAGLYVPATIGDYIWFDSNPNGLQEFEEQPYNETVTVKLIDDLGYTVQETESDVTTGFYEFTAVRPGAYAVHFILTNDDYGFTIPHAGNDTAIDSDVSPTTGKASVVVTSGQVELDIDAGIMDFGPYYPDWTNDVQCMANEQFKFYKNGDICDTKIFFEDWETNSPADWTRTTQFDTVEECCANMFWFDFDGCIGRSPVMFKFDFCVDIKGLVDPPDCQTADIFANVIGDARSLDEGHITTAANISKLGGVSLTEDDGTTVCGGDLAGEGFTNELTGTTVDIAAAADNVATVCGTVTVEEEECTSEACLNEHYNDIVQELEEFVNNGEFTEAIRSRAETRLPSVPELMPVEALAHTLTTQNLVLPATITGDLDWKFFHGSDLTTCMQKVVFQPNETPYDNLVDCCTTHFQWDVEGCCSKGGGCPEMGIAADVAPDEDAEGTVEYYFPTWVEGKLCDKKAQFEDWENEKYNTLAECCDAKFPGFDNNDCLNPTG